MKDDDKAGVRASWSSDLKGTRGSTKLAGSSQTVIAVVWLISALIFGLYGKEEFRLFGTMIFAFSAGYIFRGSTGTARPPGPKGKKEGSDGNLE